MRNPARKTELEEAARLRVQQPTGFNTDGMKKELKLPFFALRKENLKEETRQRYEKHYAVLEIK